MLALPSGPNSGTDLPTAPTPGSFAAAWAGARRQWLLAGLFGLVLGAAPAAAYYTQTPQKYTLTTTLQISAHDPVLQEREVRNQEAEYRKAQVALVRTRPVVKKALENRQVADSALFRGRPNAEGWLESELKVIAAEGGQIRVSLTGENPGDLAAALNAVTAAYLTLVVDAEETQRRLRVVEMDKVLAMSESRIRKQRDELRALTEKLWTTDTQSQNLKHQMTLQQHGGLQKDLLAVESQLRTAQALLEVQKAKLEAAKGQPIPEAAAAAALAADSAVKAASEDAARLRDVLAESVGTLQPGSPAHAQITAAAKAAEGRLEAVEAQRRVAVLKQLREELVRQTTAAHADTEAQIQLLEHQRTGLRAETDAAKREAEKVTGLGSFELELKRAEIAETEATMRKLRAEKERLVIDMQTYKRRVNVASPAEAAAAKPAASAVTAAAGLGAVGFVVGVLGVGYLESRRRRLVHLRDVADVMRLRVVGSLPLVPKLASGPLPGVWGGRFGDTGALLAEAVSDLRTMLLSGNGRDPQVVMVTSASQGEGKTTLACLLALSLALVGKRTLLVDADLRNPQVADRLALSATAGLGEVLRGEVSALGVVGRLPGTDLAVLLAGRPCPAVIHGLSVDRVRGVFTDLREQFDYIVVDSCPALLADVLVIGACVDAAVLVVRSGVSEEPVVREACERMLAAHVPLVGGVVNGLHPSRRRRYPSAAVPASRASDESNLPLAVEV